ncbi:hypothetical protein ABZ478_34785 [Streptomyces sp. NPDC005706]|uniref:hypothetical protein n=1 Tax=Streptomyces sp. NPDC005706 TaxID=3157169 RepID=UPI0033CC34E8
MQFFEPMKERGLGYAEISQRLRRRGSGFSETTLSRIGNGQRVPDRPVVAALLDLVGELAGDPLTKPVRDHVMAVYYRALGVTRPRQLREYQLTDKVEQLQAESDHKLARDTRKAPAVAVDSRPLGRYLRAVRQAAAKQPYPSLLGDTGLPLLTEAYVRQRAQRLESDGGEAAAVCSGPTIPTSGVFEPSCGLRLLLAGPGGGKSSLLRVHIADSADRWLSEEAGRTVPVLVNAITLTGTAPLPAALASATTTGRHSSACWTS